MELGVFVLLFFFLVYVSVYVVVIVNIHKFNLNYYNFGIILYRRSIKSKYYTWSNKDGIYREEVGKYVFIPKMKLGYFTTRFNLFKYRNLIFISRGIPLTIFGEFYENEGQINIVFKITYVALVLPLILTVMLLIFISMAILKGNVALVFFGVMIIAIVLIVLYILFNLQKVKVSVIANELQNLLK